MQLAASKTEPESHSAAVFLDLACNSFLVTALGFMYALRKLCVLQS